MSFNAGPNIEAQRDGYGDFDILCTSITDGLYELSSNINVLKRLLSKLNTNKATHASEERLVSVAEESTQRFKKLGQDVKLMADWDSKALTATQRFSQQKLGKEFTGLLNEFRSLQKTISEKQKAKNEANKAALVQESDERTPLMGSGSTGGNQQQQLYTQQLNVVNQDDVDFQNSLILERESEIQTIEQGVNEINTIFRDLGTLVSQQGAQIDTVEENISNLASNSENASKQLKQADEYQRKRRNWSCCVLIVLAVIVTVILLALLT